MSITINGTTGIAGVDGSAATPSVQGADANTGMFFPAADTVALTTGGSERMRVDSSGNVGIGTSSPTGKLHVNGGTFDSITISGNSANSVGMRFQNSAASSRNYNIGSSGGGPSPAGSFFIYDDTAAAARMTIDSSGNVGIGTSSPAVKLDVLSDGLILRLRSTTSTAAYLRFDGTGTSFPFIGLIGGIGTFGNTDASPLRFNTDSTERMRINSSGNVGIGTTSPTGRLSVTGTSTGSQLTALTLSNEGLTASSTVRLNFLTGEDGTAGRTRALIEASSPATNDGALAFYTRSAGSTAERMRIDASGNLLFNSGYGSVATAFGCRAWVNFNGTGTVAIRASGNVTSITDNGTGQYTVNFTNAMPDVNYSVAASAEKTSGQARPDCIVGVMTGGAATGSVAIGTVTTGAFTDFPTVSVTIFR